MRRVSLTFGVVCCIGLACAQESAPRTWQSILEGGKCEEARQLCTELAGSKNPAKVVEGHKCLANVVLCGNSDVLTLQGNDAGGGLMTSTYKAEAVDKALAHLNEALKLAPQDLSIHQGRLHLLEISSRYSDMTNALDETCRIYKGSEGVDPWLAYVSELFEDKQYRASLGLLEVLIKYYPDSHEVLGNLGAVHSVLMEDDKAIPYLQRAVELSPKDPIDAWNLARTYDYAGKVELADQWYQKALSLDLEPARKKHGNCVYSHFVENKLQDHKRACSLQRASCAETEQSACLASK